MKRFLLGFGLVTAVAYALRDRIPFLRARQERFGGGTLPTQPSLDVDDVTLTRKVETEIFRDADVPKGQINVNAEYGRVVLRGEVESEDLIRDLVERTRRVEGVKDVENLLHTPDTEVPA